MRPLLAVAMAVAVALSGCATDSKKQQDGTDASEDDTGNNTTAAPQVFSGTGSITVSGGVASIGSEGVPFEVKAGATLLFAEIAWDDPVQDIDLALSSPATGSAAGETNYDHSAPGGAPGSPDSPHNLTIEGPMEGGWEAGATASRASGTVEYRLAITVFYDVSTVPAGYSAL